MSHYDIDYSEMSEPEKARKARRDIREYIGAKRYIVMVDYAATYERSYVEGLFEIFLGVSGYPVKAFCDKFCIHH